MTVPWRRRSALAVVVAALLQTGVASAAEFEGRIDVRITSRKSGQAAAVAKERVYVSPLGLRSETIRERESGADKVAVLRLRSDPGVAYRLSEDRKTYRVTKLRTEPGTAREHFKTNRLGRTVVGPFVCQHIVLDGDRGTVIEQWITRSIKGLEHWTTEQHRAHALMIAPAPAVDGLPVKVILRSPNGVAITWEVTGVERRGLSKELFDLAGYQPKSDDEDED